MFSYGIKCIEVHNYAPELNKIHLVNGEIISSPHITDEKEAERFLDAVDNEKHTKDFEAWWNNEAMEHMTYFSEEGELTVYNLCLTAWLNGAYKAKF